MTLFVLIVADMKCSCLYVSLVYAAQHTANCVALGNFSRSFNKPFYMFIMPFINSQRSLILKHTCNFPSTAEYIISANTSRVILSLSFQKIVALVLIFGLILYSSSTVTSNLCLHAHSSYCKSFTFLVSHLSRFLAKEEVL